MKDTRRKLPGAVGLAAGAVGAAGMTLLGLGVALPPVAGAATSGGSHTYTATLAPVPKNGQTGASGTLKLVLTGTKATITEHVTGLGATFTGKPYPHVQHIHGLAKGVCPTTSTKTTTGVISTGDASPTYGGILTTLSVTPGGTKATPTGANIAIAPSGGSFTYSRTITLNATTMKAIQTNNAVIVVHGLTPKTAPKAAATLKSTVPGTTKFPLAATAPAICGKLVASQVSSVPSGAPQTGGGSTAGTQDVVLFGVGGGLLVAGAGLLVMRRRINTSNR